jgi:hypothetical protein
LVERIRYFKGVFITEIEEFQDRLLEDSKIRTEMSKKRTKYSKIKTFLAISAFIFSLVGFYIVIRF